MIALLLLLAGAPGSTQAQDDFLLAWKAAEQAPSEAERSGARAALLLRAGAPEAAYEEARRGLRADPDDPTLLFHEATAAVWLGDGTRARDAAGRLLEAVQAAATLPDAASWEASARRRLAEAGELLAKEQALARAVARARACSIAVFVLLSSGLLAWRWADGLRQGRSSSPVS
ncbi:MAG TPA: hypothetical protein VF530_04235 [Planctomycetota bacterium]